jgi:hypothetical protein
MGGLSQAPSSRVCMLTRYVGVGVHRTTLSEQIQGAHKATLTMEAGVGWPGYVWGFLHPGWLAVSSPIPHPGHSCSPLSTW